MRTVCACACCKAARGGRSASRAGARSAKGETTAHLGSGSTEEDLGDLIEQSYIERRRKVQDGLQRRRGEREGCQLVVARALPRMDRRCGLVAELQGSVEASGDSRRAIWPGASAARAQPPSRGEVRRPSTHSCRRAQLRANRFGRIERTQRASESHARRPSASCLLACTASCDPVGVLLLDRQARTRCKEAKALGCSSRRQ